MTDQYGDLTEGWCLNKRAQTKMCHRLETYRLEIMHNSTTKIHFCIIFIGPPFRNYDIFHLQLEWRPGILCLGRRCVIHKPVKVARVHRLNSGRRQSSLGFI